GDGRVLGYSQTIVQFLSDVLAVHDEVHGLANRLVLERVELALIVTSGDVECQLVKETVLRAGLNVVRSKRLEGSFATDVVRIHVQVTGFKAGDGRVRVRLLNDHDRIEPATTTGSFFFILGFNFNLDDAGDLDG